MEEVSSIDLIIEKYKEGIDETLLIENLKLTYTERRLSKITTDRHG
ncbi:MAG TPA: hypothetical protein PK079_01305 [Leptospiraceae bacterium]|nr:hypothetical protein [Leptospiraceae bacterium]HMW03849.1 hypothetical protein [Leptospiraceae bacterium]HMX32898.1 hypothetical protein [Leptospiraceae bacterium]HMY29829.1 hypothetical protein [Leptospiraceae bacterium]HMZ65189.1 hypothetical protein [Leptospiraceae bacterium]